MQENGEFFAIFSLEDARVASYSLEVRGKNICQTTGKSKTDGGLSRRGMKMVIYLHISGKSSNFVRGMGNILKTTQTTCARIVRRSRSFDRREIRTPASAQDDNYTTKIVEYYKN